MHQLNGLTILKKKKMDNIERRKNLRHRVETEIKANINNDFNLEKLDEEGINHIIDVSISIIETRDNTGPQGGSFVKAIVSNDLEGALNHVSPNILKTLKFLSYVNQHVGKQ